MKHTMTIDLETTIHSTVGKLKGSPWHLPNYSVWSGWKYSSTMPIRTSNAMGDLIQTILNTYRISSSRNEDLILVGQNIKFDLGYLIRNSELRRLIFSGEIIVWDIQLGDAMLTGVEKKFPSLDYMSEKHGLPVKDSKMKEYWNAGISTEDIPKDEIIPYLEQDVSNTYAIYKEQMAQLDSNDLLMNNCILQMEALVTTLLMEYNGMYFDTDLANTAIDVLNIQVQNLKDTLEFKMGLSGMVEANAQSVQQVAVYLYGGNYNYVRKEAMLDTDGNVVIYKSGKRKGEIRYVNNKYQVKVKPKVPEIESGRTTDDKTIKEIIKSTPLLKGWCESLLSMRKLKKELSTYFIGYSQHTWEHDSCIHTSFNHTATATGRLSSTNPNIQNVTRS